MLAHPHANVPTTITIDALGVAGGAALERLINGSWQPIGFFSRQLRPPEPKCSAWSWAPNPLLGSVTLSLSPPGTSLHSFHKLQAALICFRQGIWSVVSLAAAPPRYNIGIHHKYQTHCRKEQPHGWCTVSYHHKCCDQFRAGGRFHGHGHCSAERQRDGNIPHSHIHASTPRCPVCPNTHHAPLRHLHRAAKTCHSSCFPSDCLWHITWPLAPLHLSRAKTTYRQICGMAFASKLVGGHRTFLPSDLQSSE